MRISDWSSDVCSSDLSAPAGQSTQMIVGADQADDRAIIRRASALYSRHRLRRVYYSAFSPIPSPSSVLPLKRPPLMREHRLYQSDWMMRFYGYSAQELESAADPATGCRRSTRSEEHTSELPSLMR